MLVCVRKGRFDLIPNFYSTINAPLSVEMVKFQKSKFHATIFLKLSLFMCCKKECNFNEIFEIDTKFKLCQWYQIKRTTSWYRLSNLFSKKFWRMFCLYYFKYRHTYDFSNVASGKIFLMIKQLKNIIKTFFKKLMWLTINNISEAVSAVMRL